MIEKRKTKEKGEDFLSYKFTELAPCQPKRKRSIEVNNREIKYILCADDVIWFDFSQKVRLFSTSGHHIFRHTAIC